MTLYSASLFLLVKFAYVFRIIGAQCPTMSSGKCFVDCTVQSVFTIACEDIKGQQLFDDLRNYRDSNQPVQLAVWNSPMTRIGAAILDSVSDDLLRLELDNILYLEYFPELRDQTNLKELVIMNSPLLAEMPLELLPPTIQRVVLYRTGITQLLNDFDETQSIPGLRELVFVNGRLTEVQGDFFRAFPNMESLQIINSTFSIQQIPNKMVSTVKPLKFVRIAHNIFESGSQRICESMLNGVSYQSGAFIDFIANEFSITAGVVEQLWKFREAKHLSFQGNAFQDFVHTSWVFADYNQLEMLDLRHTNFLPARSSFAGLPNLKQLYLGGNAIRDLTVINMFAGSLSTNLTLLDLSDNGLRLLPIGMEPVSPQLTELDLSGNQLNIGFMFEDDTNHYITHFRLFPNLKKLDLSGNKMKRFNGTHLSRIKNLEHLNIGCNNFMRIDKSFFHALPKTLQILNMTFCLTPGNIAKPRFDPDAFSTLPPAVARLILQKGYLDSSIFAVFKNANIPTLRQLDLGFNAIGIITEELCQPLADLETLILAGNQLQSLGYQTFRGMCNLRALDLSWNKIFLVGTHDFDGLRNLKVLTLTGNGLTEIQPGALEPMVQLKNLYLGYNSIKDLKSLMTTLGQQLQHLGLQENPIDCIPDMFLAKMINLKWIYLNSSRGMNLDLGTFQRLGSTMSTYPFKLWAFKEPVLSDLGCESWDDWSAVYQRSLKFVIKDKMDTVLQNMLINFPSCHMERPRGIQALVESLICKPAPISDGPV
ncbi:toll-like receptor 13 [Paramacrobiotus metropolitanus]|uniref:toll-like receptor 13 n=1 Tax=Paramacrobiotus metropolitanus TaxID=2943436 RepID=UPI002445DE47|nr:toll-like receptor 13 [Paramacrobiotus metropolitanus]